MIRDVYVRGTCITFSNKINILYYFKCNKFNKTITLSYHFINLLKNAMLINLLFILLFYIMVNGIQYIK